MTGKTVITLTAINDLKYNRFEVSKVLVIAPKKVAEATWSTECAKWDHLQNLRIKLVLGSAQKRIRAVNSPADVYVINRENVPWLVEYYRNNWPFDTVIIDELSSFKSNRAKRFKALSWVRPHIKRIVGLTGTPTPSGIKDIWAQIFLLDQGERLGKTITAFREDYLTANTHGGHFTTYEERQGAFDEIRARISDICVSMSAKDYLTLPPCTEVVVPVHLDDIAAKHYAELERNLVLELDESTITAAMAATLTGKLLQMCSGDVYDGDKNVVHVHDCKIEAFMELVESAVGKPIFVFYSYKHELSRLKAALSKTGLTVGELKSPEDIERWNAGKINILLAHPKSAAYGLNLQDGGHHICWYSLPWSLELYQQACARLYRQGQENHVIIHHLVVQGGMDESVIAALEGKKDAQNALLDALKARITEVKRNDT